MLSMLYYSFYLKHPEKEGYRSIEEGVQRLLSDARFHNEILEILTFKYQPLETMELKHDFDFHCEQCLAPQPVNSARHSVLEVNE